MLIETLADVTPVTVYPIGHSGLAKKSQPKRKPSVTRNDLAVMCEAKGLKVLKAHTKAELQAMLKSSTNVRPAAYDRNNAARKAKRAAAQ